MKTLNPRARSNGLDVAAFVFTAVVVLLYSSCGSVELQSHWQESVVTIDGVNQEWNDEASFLEDPGVAISVSNDAEYIYVCLMTSKRSVQRQVMSQGLIVWFDGGNDKTKDFGIKFPLGISEAGDVRPDREPGRPGEAGEPEPGERPGDRRGAGPGDGQKMFDEMFDAGIARQSEFDVIGPAGAGVRRVEFGEIKRIEVKAGRSRGTFVYELKVPLHSEGDDFYAVNSNAGDVIDVCLESPEIDREAMRERWGGGRPPGGMGGPGGGTGGPGGTGGMGGPGGMGARSRGDFERPQPFEVWASVRLATRE